MSNNNKTPKIIRSLGFYLYYLIHGLSSEDDPNLEGKKTFVLDALCIKRTLIWLLSGGRSNGDPDWKPSDRDNPNDYLLPDKHQLDTYYLNSLLSSLMARDNPQKAAEDYFDMVIGHLFWKTKSDEGPYIVRFQESLRERCMNEEKRHEEIIFPASIWSVIQRGSQPEPVEYRSFTQDSLEKQLEVKNLVIDTLSGANRLYEELRRLRVYPLDFRGRINLNQSRELFKLLDNAWKLAQEEETIENPTRAERRSIDNIGKSLMAAYPNSWERCLKRAWQNKPLKWIGDDKGEGRYYGEEFSDFIKHEVIQEILKTAPQPISNPYDDEIGYEENDDFGYEGNDESSYEDSEESGYEGDNFQNDPLNACINEEEREQRIREREQKEQEKMQQKAREKQQLDWFVVYFFKAIQRLLSEDNDLKPAQRSRLRAIVNSKKIPNMPEAKDEETDQVLREIGELIYKKYWYDIFKTAFNIYFEEQEAPEVKNACRRLADWLLTDPAEREELSQAEQDDLRKALSGDEFFSVLAVQFNKFRDYSPEKRAKGLLYCFSD